MKPENVAFLLIALGVVVVATVAGAYFLVVPPKPSLPVAAGTVFSANDTRTWVAYFDVSPEGGQIVGAWTAFDGSEWVALLVTNNTTSGPWSHYATNCPASSGPFAEQDSSVNAHLESGPYAIYWWLECGCASRIVITSPIQFVAAE
jgi:hypothetical protein